MQDLTEKTLSSGLRKRAMSGWVYGSTCDRSTWQFHESSNIIARENSLIIGASQPNQIFEIIPPPKSQVNKHDKPVIQKKTGRSCAYLDVPRDKAIDTRKRLLSEATG